ncbi:ATP-binding protein [Lysobacter sp. A03]|uniref:sensor histidine kinase n=1 Tax=Lysobacter sp. A03 TaxID=1199154 RepID=UPI0005B6C1F3|nr:ATP-binding protein [Lysobacter sp. A03]KIQ97035.1 Sensory box histidine kinase [Lysobacter sp. A03]
MSPTALPPPADDRFRAAMAASAWGMAILELDGTWQETNPAMRQLLGGAPGAPLADGPAAGTIFEVIAADEVEDLRHSVDALIASGQPAVDRGLSCRRADDTFQAWISISLMRDGAGAASGLVVQLREDTGAGHATALDAMRRQLQAQVDAVAHDLRAPLRSINNFSGLLARKLDEGLDATSRDHLGRIRGAAARMAGLLDGLAELSRASTAQMREGLVDLSMLADWVGAEQQDAHPDREFLITVQPGLSARGDERLLKTLLAQLLDNTRRFSHDDGPVSVDVAGTQADGMLRLSISDRGRGFDMRYRHKLFEPFQRLHGADEGAGDGLGLAIAQRIAERHGGRIDAESQPDSGSVFHLYLPAAQTAGAAPGE